MFEYGGAIIIEGGYYGIGEVHILTADGTSTVQHKDNASYYLHINDSGELYYKLLHNGIAGISQTGGLTVATSYDEFLSAEGYASIDGCNVVFNEAYESYVISDKYDLDKEFELNYKQDYGSIEEKFAENVERYGVEVTTEVTTTATKEPTEPKYITETVTFDFVRYFEGSIEVGGGTFDGDFSITYTYAEGLKPAGFSLFDVSGDEDFPENGYYEEMQTHNGVKPAWATVTKRSILRRDAGDILIEYVDGENNGPVLAYWRASDDYIIKFGFSECSFVTEADIEMLANTFVFKDLTVEDWTYTYITPNYDAWEETEGEYVIWEFTKNADGEFELTYSEGDILCIPYVTIGSDNVIYATTKTIIPPALEIGKLHILKAHDEIVRLFLEDTLEGSVGTKVADSIYAENFAKYCEAEPEKADVLRELSGKLRDVFKVYINGEAVDGIGVALPSYCFIKDYQYEWQFLFSKAYAKEDVNIVRIELKIPESQESTTSDVSQSEPTNISSGSCGEGVSYTFDTDSGKVRIFGTGEMSYYGDEFVPCGFAPWHYDARVKSVVIEDGVTSICDMAFYGCTALSNVTIPQSVTSIGKNAFNGCHSLWEISIPDSVLYIGDGAFTYCNSIKEFVIPQGVTSISPSMFFACEKLEKITIPDSVTYIGYNVFERCNSLSEISIPSSVTEIGELAFAYCSSLKEITLPQGVTNLNRGIFYNCTALEKIALPEGLTSIGATVFHGSTALLEITIPGSVTSIDETAFMYGNLSLVRAPLGSYAEQFAKNNNIEFEEVNVYVS